MMKAIKKLLRHWKDQNISLTGGKSSEEIQRFERDNNVRLPEEIREYFSKVNGMELLYPNYADKEGFLFYPLECIVDKEEEYRNVIPDSKQYLIFADYLQRCWSYGILTDNRTGGYEIAILTHSYKAIANSFAEFIELYIENSDKLYDYD